MFVVFAGADDGRKAWASFTRATQRSQGGGGLVLIQAGEALAGLESLLDPPAGSGDAGQGGQRYWTWAETAVVGHLAGGAVAADQ